MEHIKRAIERAKSELPITEPRTVEMPSRQVGGLTNERLPQKTGSAEFLERNRIFPSLRGNPYRFDQLRTRVLQEMRDRGWKTLMVTSPTAGCGKTVTAINLAMSMARQPETFTILADFDLRKPQIADYLGVRPEFDLYDVLKSGASLNDTLFSLDICGDRLAFLPTLAPAAQPSEILSSSKMARLVTSLKDLRREGLVVFDMPPVLVADDVMAFSAQVDGILLVVAAGQSKASEVDETRRALPSEKLLGVILAKNEEKPDQYYY